MEDNIMLAHGDGGRLSHMLIENIFQKAFYNPILNKMLDSAVIKLNNLKLAFTTDSFVVNPIFFPGGDIGKLAVCGTINDLAVCGAIPSFLSVGMIIEEGFPIDDLKKIVHSMSLTAKQAGVQIVTGDTKIVEKGAADKIFINTAGIGIIDNPLCMEPARIKPGDAVLVSGNIGEHGLTILLHRHKINIKSPVQSDCSYLSGLTQILLKYGQKIRCMRDPTRGGLATSLNELAKQSGYSISVLEESIPIAPVVKGACNLLGLDPLYLANEGKLIAVVAKESKEAILNDMRNTPEGQNTCVIGEIRDSIPSVVTLETKIGTRRILPMLEGSQLPRIC